MSSFGGVSRAFLLRLVWQGFRRVCGHNKHIEFFFCGHCMLCSFGNAHSFFIEVGMVESGVLHLVLHPQLETRLFSGASLAATSHQT